MMNRTLPAVLRASKGGAMRRVLVGVRRTAIVAAIVCCTAPAATAMAGQPVTPNCVGTTFSGAAHALPPGGVAQVVVGFAQGGPGGGPGLGGGIQALQAGHVPDTDAPNTCNDD